MVINCVLFDRCRDGRHTDDGFYTRFAGRVFAYEPRVPAIFLIRRRRRRRLLNDCTVRLVRAYTLVLPTKISFFNNNVII